MLEVDGLVLKVARSADRREELAREAAVLHALEGRVRGVRIPRRIEGTPAGVSLHRRLPGDPVSPSRYAAMADGDRERFGASVGAFLAGLHALDPIPAAAQTLEQRDWPRAPAEIRSRLLAEAAGVSQRRFIRRTLAWIEEGLAARGPERFCHGDLHGDNLGARVDGAVISVFDFADAARADRHLDFQYFDQWHPDLLDRVARAYRESGGAPVDVARALCFSALVDLEDLEDHARHGTVPAGSIPKRIDQLAARLGRRGIMSR